MLTRKLTDIRWSFCSKYVNPRIEDDFQGLSRNVNFKSNIKCTSRRSVKISVPGHSQVGVRSSHHHHLLTGALLSVECEQYRRV